LHRWLCDMNTASIDEHRDALGFEQEPTVTICECVAMLRALIEREQMLGGAASLDGVDALSLTLPDGNAFSITIRRKRR
jgi:hypothetical protein